MNIRFLVPSLWSAALLGISFVCLGQAQEEQTSSPAQEIRVKDRQGHQQRVELVRTVQDDEGQSVTVTNSYIQLENGLNYRDDNGLWTETKPEFELVENGAIAWKGQHRVSLAGDLNTAGAIQLRLPDGRLMEGHVLGLAYYDASTGDSALIATVKDSQGWLVTTNQITYPDAFEGAAADVRYTFSRSGFEQDVILREQPPAPENYGFSSASTRLEVWTEFTSSVEPNETYRLASLKGKESGEEDETLDFGSMRIGEGQSFLLGAETDDAQPVRKSWIKSPNDGRKFLVEAVALPAVSDALEALPASTEGVSLPVKKSRSRMQALNSLPLKTRRASAQTAMHRLETRKDMVAAYQKPGLVLDYQFTVSGDQTDCTLASDTTYLITGSRDFLGTTTLEGGCVIKFEKYVSGSVDPRLYIRGPFICKTSKYLPAIFTAKTDNSVGEALCSSGCDPGTDKYAYYPIRFYNAPNARVENVHLRNCVAGFSFQHTNSGMAYTVAHAQIVNCQIPFHMTSTNMTVNCHNVLVENVLTGSSVFNGVGSSCQFYGENLTIHTAPTLWGNCTLSLKNSLLVQVTNISTYTSTNNIQLSSETGVFQTVYAGGHYLPLGSPYRNAATAPIDSTLAADLKSLTTEAPELLSGFFSSLVKVMQRRVQRDTDVPDLGYHYPPLDYLVSSVTIGDGITLDRAVAIAAVGSTGLKLEASALAIEGRAEMPSIFTRYNGVQERVQYNDPGGALIKIAGTYSPRPTLSLRFCELAACNQSGGVPLLDNGITNAFGSFTVEFCRLVNLGLNLWPNDSSAETVTFRNNLWERCNVTLKKMASPYNAQNTPLSVTAQNNLLWRGTFALGYEVGTNSNPSWTFSDNLLDLNTNSLVGTNYYVTTSYNGFTAGTSIAAGSLYNGNFSKTDLLSAYQTNAAWGERYYPSSGATNSLAALIDTGSQSRTAAGLYHFTVKSALGTKEGLDASSTVDIGYHYVGLESTSGLPFDTDGDGIPDYVEDRNGNNNKDSGETDPSVSNNGVTTSGASSLIIFTPLL